MGIVCMWLIRSKLVITVFVSLVKSIIIIGWQLMGKTVVQCTLAFMSNCGLKGEGIRIFFKRHSFRVHKNKYKKRELPVASMLRLNSAVGQCKHAIVTLFTVVSVRNECPSFRSQWGMDEWLAGTLAHIDLMTGWLQNICFKFHLETFRKQGLNPFLPAKIESLYQGSWFIIVFPTQFHCHSLICTY